MFKFLLKKLLIVMLLALTMSMFAQDRLLTMGENNNVMNDAVLLSQNDNQTTIRFDVNAVSLKEVETDLGFAFIASSDKAPLMLQAESPELFYLTSSFIIPDRGSSELKISYGAFQDFENIEIAPSKGSFSRNIDPATVPYKKGDVYQKDAFFPGTLARLRDPFIMRDVRGQSLDVYPVQYNPVTKVLRVYSEITVSVIYTENAGINEFTNQKRHKTFEPQFNEMYQRLFINNSVIQGRGYPTGEEGELLIICHTPWVNEMQPYVDWKRTIGRKTTIVPTSAISPLTAANLKTYIVNYYNNPDNNLAYVLLVGDVAQIPTHIINVPTPPYGSKSPATDNYLGLITGGDAYLEVLIARMSAESVAHVQTQVQRSIWYERDLTTTATWIKTGMGIARNEGYYGINHPNGHDGQENDYRHQDSIRARLLKYGYSPVYQDYDYNCPGIPNTNATIMTQHFNDGVSMVNFTNHGTMTSWSVGNYNISNVNALQNAGKLPFIYSVACNNGEFNSGTCFAEAWMRATQGGQPTGAVATFMATVSLGWQPGMTAQDEFVDICLDTTHTAVGGFNYGLPGLKMRTIAGAMLNGSQKMMMRHGTTGEPYADFLSWHVFGDPTLNFRTKTPQNMTISHPDVISLGMQTFTVQCDANGSLAALTYTDNGEVIILGTAVVESGNAVIAFNETLTIGMNLTIAVTGFNKVAYLGTVSVGEAPELPAPFNLRYKVEKANHVILDWDAPVGKSLPVKGYFVYRDDVLITLEPVRDSRTYTDIVPANGEYKYAVTALYDDYGTLESDPCEPVTVLIDGMCVPFDKDIVAKQVTDEYSIHITWEAPKYEGIELAGYNIYRDTGKINTALITGLNFTDIDLKPEIEYCYHVEAVYNDCEEPLKSNEECLTLPRIVSICEPSGSETIRIFPNPTTGELRMENGEWKIENVEIFDVVGKLTTPSGFACHPSKGGELFPSFGGAGVVFDISHLPTGIYFLRIQTETDVITKKIVKK